ncbi:hypothetical protein TNCV_3706981 [Trichonephila clavipes]|nr:hypothetical protein TNCV_3706981 [Trichonephila clavipes]
MKLDGYLEYSHAEKVLYIYKHTYLLRDSNPGPTAQHSPLQCEVGGPHSGETRRHYHPDVLNRSQQPPIPDHVGGGWFTGGRR